MTCVVGLREAGKIWIGADSAGVSGWSLTLHADLKVFINGLFIFGFTSSFRMGQLLRYRFTPPEMPLSMSDEPDRYMRTIFIDEVRNCLRTYSYSTVENSVEKGGEFLCGVAGNLYTIYNDFQVAELVCPYQAIGIGGELALGSMYSTTGTDKSPEDRILLALDAAEAFSTGVRRPFTVLSI